MLLERSSTFDRSGERVRKQGAGMKRFKVHIFCTIVACAFLIIVRGTRTVDYTEMFRGWKNAAVVALKQRYEQTKTYMGREVVSPVMIESY